MRRRDILDWLLVFVTGLLTYVVLVQPPSKQGLQSILDALLGLDVRVYVVVGGLGGVLFLFYLVAWAPSKATG